MHRNKLENLHGSVQISVPHEMIKRTMVRYTAHLVFTERLFLIQTCFFLRLKALEIFDNCVSSSTSSMLWGTVEPSYLNLVEFRT